MNQTMTKCTKVWFQKKLWCCVGGKVKHENWYETSYKRGQITIVHKTIQELELCRGDCYVLKRM